MTKPFAYDRARAMKQTDVKPCCRCGKGMMHTGIPVFYRVTIDIMGVDGRAVQRQHGLEQMLGGAAAVAQAMGENADIGLPIGAPLRGLLCHSCALAADVTFAELVEALRPGDDEIADRAEARSAKAAGS